MTQFNSGASNLKLQYQDLIMMNKTGINICFVTAQMEVRVWFACVLFATEGRRLHSYICRHVLSLLEANMSNQSAHEQKEHFLSANIIFHENVHSDKRHQTL